jgi:hypothetical protein
MKTRAIAFVLMAVVTGFAWTASATVSDYIPVGGVLADLDGEPLEGSYGMTFALYNAADATTPLWSETYAAVEIEGGLFTVYLGSVTALDFGALILAPELWLGVTVGTDSEMDRIPLGTVPFAMEAYQCLQIGDLQAGDIQPVLSGANLCPPGTFLRGWDDVGLVPVCEPDAVGAPFSGRAMAPTGNVIHDVDTAGTPGEGVSATIGVDGMGIISYFDTTSGELRAAHCDDVGCAASTTSVVDGAAAGTAGWAMTSIAIGADGMPFIVYTDTTAVAIKAAHCGDVACTTATITTIQASTGTYPSVVIGSDGLPLIAYRSTGGTSGGLRVAHCDEVTCASSTISDTAANVYASDSVTIALGADGLGTVVFKRWQSGATDIRASHCQNVACTAADNYVVADNSDDRTPAATVGPDGLVLYAWDEFMGGCLHVGHCDNSACSTATDLATGCGWQQTDGTYSITVGSDHLPLVVFSNYSTDTMFALHCDNAECSENRIVSTVTPAGVAGGNTAVTIGVDGNPLIAFQDSVAQQLKVVHCSNPFCAPYLRWR